MAYVKDRVAVEEGAEGIADQDGRQQPGEQQGVFQDGALFLFLEDIAAGDHHDHAGEGRRDRREDKA